MIFKHRQPVFATLASLAISNFAGCSSCEKCGYMGDITPKPLGTISDQAWRQQESNAEASDFVVYEHEWAGNHPELNQGGMEHVKQIAARAASTPFPIVVERSSMSVKEDTKYGFPIHNDEELDLQRRDFLVSALQGLGVPDAAERVVISPALTPGFTEYEAERAYGRAINGSMNGFGFGRGGGGGGFY